MIKQILFIATLFSLLCVSPEVIIAGAEDDIFRAAVEEIYDTYSSMSMKKDVDGWTALWDEEGVKMVPNLPSIYGKAAIREHKHKKSQSPDDMEMSIKVENAQVAGDFGFAHGTAFVSITPKDGGAVKYRYAKFLTIFKKQTDGSWKIYRDSVSANPASK